MYLTNDNLVIRISGSKEHVVRVFLSVFLSKERLTDKQLDVTTALVLRYAEYIAHGVKEPYASALLFSTGTRKEIVQALNMSSAHLSNTFDALQEKNVLAFEDGKYSINPQLIPNSSLKFEFVIADGQQG